MLINTGRGQVTNIRNLGYPPIIFALQRAPDLFDALFIANSGPGDHPQMNYCRNGKEEREDEKWCKITTPAVINNNYTSNHGAPPLTDVDS